MKSIRELKSTSGMTLSERYELLEKYEKIPIGDKIWRAGDFTERECLVTVTKENQNEVTMFWNALYFDSEKEAEFQTDLAHIEYCEWLYSGCI